MISILIILAGIPLGINLYIRFNPQFGGRPTKELKEQYSKSPQWKKGTFENLLPTSMNFSPRKIPGLIRQQIRGRKDRTPKKNIPILPFDRSAFEADQSAPKFIWYGHSVLLMRISGKNILIDPMFGPDSSPIGPITTKRFSADSLEVIDQLPDIDLVLQTHDHYDHLDYKSILKLKDKVKHFWVGLGIGRHLQKWGIENEKIREFDWWDEAGFADISITYTPSRHFSGRGTTDRSMSLWGGWTLKTSENNIYWSGDGGYGPHFEEIGQRLGPFDIGFMECGQYNELWHQIHMYPEESVWAAMDAKCAWAMPVHWGGFILAPHHWKDPINRFTVEAEKKNIPFTTPAIGEISILGSVKKTERWWDNY